MILVDTCVLVDVLGDDPVWADWSQAQLEAWSARGALVINPIIYAELAAAIDAIEALDDVVQRAGLAFSELPRNALFLAGRAFALYRKRGGTRSSLLADFLIGAHASVARIPVLTRDTARYRSYFPQLKLVAP